MYVKREMEQIRGYMIDEETRESVGTEEGTRRDTWTDVCGGMVGWDCLCEIRTETGFG
jgi:hypothetical protein